MCTPATRWRSEEAHKAPTMRATPGARKEQHNGMPVCVRSLTGSTLAVCVPEDATGRWLRQAVAHKAGHGNSCDILLLYASKELKDEHILTQRGVTAGSFIQACGRLLGGAKGKRGVGPLCEGNDEDDNMDAPPPKRSNGAGSSTGSASSSAQEQDMSLHKNPDDVLTSEQLKQLAKEYNVAWPAVYTFVDLFTNSGMKQRFPGGLASLPGFPGRMPDVNSITQRCGMEFARTGRQLLDSLIGQYVVVLHKQYKPADMPGLLKHYNITRDQLPEGLDPSETVPACIVGIFKLVGYSMCADAFVTEVWGAGFTKRINDGNHMFAPNPPKVSLHMAEAFEFPEDQRIPLMPTAEALFYTRTDAEMEGVVWRHPPGERHGKAVQQAIPRLYSGHLDVVGWVPPGRSNAADRELRCVYQLAIQHAANLRQQQQQQ